MVATQSNLLARVMRVLRINQVRLAELLHVTPRTVGRWVAGRTTCAYLPELARHVFPHDPALAEECALMAHTTTQALGLFVLHPPPAEAAAAGPPPRPVPADAHLADSIVCAAAEASDFTPKQVRPMLIAAFERAGTLGLGVREVTAALRGGKAK